MDDSSKKILITGAGGFVGSAIYSKFLDKNWNICRLGRDGDSNVFCDFSKPLDIINLNLPFKKYDLCVHVAAANEVICQKNSVSAYNINCCGTHALVELCKKYEVKKFIYISTFHVFGKQKDDLYENTTPIPKNVYGLTHYLAELELLMADMNRYFQTKIIRLPNIIGVPHDWSRFDRWTLAQFDFCKQCNERKSITLNSSGDQVRNWVNLEFITHQIYKLAQTTEDQKIHHIVGKNLSIIDLSRLIAKNWELIFNQKIKIKYPSTSPILEVKKTCNFSSLNKVNINKRLNLDLFVENVGIQLKKT